MTYTAPPSVRNITGQYVLHHPFVSGCLSVALHRLLFASRLQLWYAKHHSPVPTYSLLTLTCPCSTSLTVAMMSRITIDLKRFGHNPNGVIHQDLNLPSALRQHFQPPDQTIPSLAFATLSEAPYSPNVTMTLGSAGGMLAASGNESYCAIQTISTVAAMPGEPYTQHPPKLPPRTFAGGDHAAPRTS